MPCMSKTHCVGLLSCEWDDLHAKDTWRMGCPFSSNSPGQFSLGSAAPPTPRAAACHRLADDRGSC